MNQQQTELYDRIRSFRFDPDGTTYTFADRLAKENGWTTGYTARVIDEYRRFAFLAAAAGHPVSPSHDVDEAWHLHLVYTRSYWDEFCGRVLRMPLHHEPGRGAAAEKAKFADWYARTLDSYRQLFGEEPPQDIWPMPTSRAKKVERYRRMDLRRNWVLPKAWASAVVGMVALIFLAPALAPAGDASPHAAAVMNPLDLRGPDFLGFYVVLVAAAFGLAWLIRWGAKTIGSPATAPVKLDPYRLAYLNGGPTHAADLALTCLYARGMLRANPDATVTALGTVRPLSDPIERAAYDAVVAHPYDRVPVRYVRSRVSRVLRPIGAELKAAGLVMRNVTAVRSCLLATLVALAAPAIGAAKVAMGISRDKPVSVLVFACLFSTVIALWTFARRPHRTRAGDAMLKQLRETNGSLEYGKSQRNLDALTLGVALFGLDVLALTALKPIYETLRPPVPTQSAGSSGCSTSSCGSSCGGGGCGGCSS